MSDTVDEVIAELFGAPFTKTALAFALTRTEPRIGKTEVKGFAVERRSVNEEKRTIEFVASTETPDRFGDIIRVKGWDLVNYRKNPVFLFGHRSTEPPIGRSVSVRIEATPPALVQTIEFADAKTYPFADTIFRLYAGGYMNAVSVGFRPTEQPQPIVDELTGRMTGYEFTKQELLELSAVSLPANVDAVAREFAPAVAAGTITSDEMQDFLDALEADEPATDADFDSLHRAYGRLFESLSLYPQLLPAVEDIGRSLDAIVFTARNRPVESVEQLEKLLRA